jgi:flavin reductase (DIM6/NTAB) family NADH-FMN oxidoreductase RutF
VTPLDPILFRQAMSRLASGVTVVTTARGTERFGLTASSFVSVSLDPPLVLVCVARALQAHRVIEESGVFAVNLLSIRQLETGLRFAGLKRDPADRFEGVESVHGVTGAPLLVDSIASLDCRLHAAHEGGDHGIFVGEVVQVVLGRDEPPLLYHERLWAKLEALPSVEAPKEPL